MLAKIASVAVLSLGLAWINAVPAMASCPGAYTICGTITSFPNTTTNFPGVLVELRDQFGTIVQSMRTTPATAGNNYEFKPITYPIPPPPFVTYYVNPGIGRTQYAVPMLNSVQVDGSGNVTPATVPMFSIGGTTITIRVQGEAPGTFVMITTMTWPTSSPPPPPPIIDQKQPTMISANTRTVGIDGTVNLGVAPGFNYYMACWKPTGSGSTVTYSYSTSANVIPGGSGTGGIFRPLDLPEPIRCP